MSENRQTTKQPERNVLHLIMKGQYYWQILNRQKQIEYRFKSKHNRKKIDNKTFTHILFQIGYNTQNQMIVPIVKQYETENHYEFVLDVNAIELINIEYRKTNAQFSLLLK